MNSYRLAVFLLTLLPVCVLAEIINLPFSRQTFSSDHKLVFVSLVDESYGRTELNDKFIDSGLYRTENPRKPLWVFDGCGELVVSVDSKHIVLLGPTVRIGNHGTTDALRFVREGKVVRTYRIEDLVKRPMPISNSHRTWCKESRLDDTNGTFLATVYAGPDGSAGATYIFDLATGNIIARRIPFSQRFPLWGWAAIAGSLILVGITAAVLRCHPRPRTHRYATIVED
jgi:hypothetical protein